MLKQNKKYFIGIKNGKIKHFKFPYSWLHEETYRDLGYNYNNVIETGIIQDNRCLILECKDTIHRTKSHKRELNNTQLKARQVESIYKYKAYSLDGD